MPSGHAVGDVADQGIVQVQPLCLQRALETCQAPDLHALQATTHDRTEATMPQRQQVLTGNFAGPVKVDHNVGNLVGEVHTFLGRQHDGGAPGLEFVDVVYADAGVQH